MLLILDSRSYRKVLGSAVRHRVSWWVFIWVGEVFINLAVYENAEVSFKPGRTGIDFAESQYFHEINIVCKQLPVVLLLNFERLNTWDVPPEF